MAIYVHCPHCHEQVADRAETCPHCGNALPIAVLQALSAASGATPPHAPPVSTGWAPTHLSHTAPQPYVAESGVFRPWLAAALSLICGLGQFYNGQVVKGLVFLGGAGAIVAAVAVLQSTVAIVIAPLWWVYAVVDAYRVGRRR